MFRSRLLPRVLPLLILISSLLAIYLRTLAPDLTWANDGSDGGDLIAAAATGGVAHPTGYPLYLLLARLFQFLPIGSLAFRTNLMSAIATVLAAALVYQLVAQRSATLMSHYMGPRIMANPEEFSKFGPDQWAGMLAGYAFGLAPLIWSQAVITEVYALQAFLTALLLYLYMGPTQPSKELDRWRGLVAGLAMGNHVTTILLLPLVFILGSFPPRSESGRPLEFQRKWFPNARFEAASLRRQLLFFGLGLSLYAVIPLRAAASPPVNWGNATTLGRFWWLVSGGEYQSYYLQFTLPEIWEGLQAGAALLLQQFGLVGVTLGLIGLIVFGAPSRVYILTIWTAILHALFALFYRPADWQVYLIPLYLSFAIWIGLSLSGLVRQLPQRVSILRFGLGLLMIGYFVARSFTYFGDVDAAHDSRAVDFGQEVLATVPDHALVFAEGDEAVFALWYFHFALGQRPDLAVMAEDLLHFDWYQATLRSTYPSLRITGPFPWPETIMHDNPDLPVCFVHYTDQAAIDCSPAEGTPP